MKPDFTKEKPKIRVGKYGVTQGVVDEIVRRLEQNNVVKIKILKSCLKNESFDGIAEKIVKLTHSNLVETRGHTIILLRN